MRVVTLLPSATEIVCALGREQDLVAVSHSCSYPPGVKDLPVVTSTHVPYRDSSDVIDRFVREHLETNTALYDLDIDALVKAAPDVIISQALCDVCAVSTGDVIAALDSLPTKPKLIDMEPNTLDDVFDDCARIGRALGEEDAAASLIDQMKKRCSLVATRTATIALESLPSVAFLEWLEPPFNGGHWNPGLVALAGGIDLLGAPGRASTTLSWDHVIESDADVLFIACCGFSKRRALDDIRRLARSETWRQLSESMRENVIVADGNAYFSCPGPRLIDGLEMMAHALHPDVHPPSAHGSCQRFGIDEYGNIRL